MLMEVRDFIELSMKENEKHFIVTPTFSILLQALKYLIQEN